MPKMASTKHLLLDSGGGGGKAAENQAQHLTFLARIRTLWPIL